MNNKYYTPSIEVIKDVLAKLQENKVISPIPQYEIDKVWESIKPKVNIEIQIEFPLIFGEPYYQPEFFDPCYNCGNNPKNNPYASGFCNCSLPSRNITY